MGLIEEIIDLLKAFVSLAKKCKNREMEEYAVEIQAKVFELNDKQHELEENNKELSTKLRREIKAKKDLIKKYADYDELKRIADNLQDANNFKFPTESISLNFTDNPGIYIGHGWYTDKKIVNTDLKEIFLEITLSMTSQISYGAFRLAFSNLCPNYYVDNKQALQIKVKLLALDLISTRSNEKGIEFIELTPLGLAIVKKLNK